VTGLLERVCGAIEAYHLLSPGETVVVGVSGGPDSLCLLHLLCRLQAGADGQAEDGWNLRLHVAHLHHGLRGIEADADAGFVQALAADWGLPVHIRHANVPLLAEEHGLAVEEAARRARYAFLAGVAEEVGARTVAVGHNADDQAETVLMHFLRGSGLAGLRGMLPRTSLAGYRLLELDPRTLAGGGIQLVRPLLDIPRADIETYCDYHGLEPCFDRSNLDTTYFRNWLRHKVIPLLEQHNPNLRQVLGRSAQVIAEDYALLRSVLEEWWPRVVVEERLQPLGAEPGEGTGERIVLDLIAWRALPASLQRSILREAVQRLRRTLRDISFVHIEDAVRVAREGSTGSRATLPRGLMLTVGYGRLTLAAADAAPHLPDWPLLTPGTGRILVGVPGQTQLPRADWILQAEVLAQRDLPADWQVNPDPWRAFLDLEAVGPEPWLRTREAGDRLQPLGMEGHSVKLCALLTNLKVPQAARDRLPLLATDWGLAWVCGQRLDRRACVRKATKQVLFLRFVRQPLDSSAL
jgi:tRNA(Ile)-lysidine synthase